MTPATIAKCEATFATNLTSNKGVKFTLKETTDIGDGFTIKSIRPAYSDYYYTTKTTKKSICLHFTVGYILSDIDALATQGNHVSVSYVVDRSGNIYELFPDSYWSYHLGSNTIGGNGTMSKQSIGIEISNYGPLKDNGDKLIDAYKNTYCTKEETEFYEHFPYRGNDYYATMTDIQIDAVEHLLKHLCAKHGIPMAFKEDDNVFASANEAIAFNGIFYHTNVRKDKFDWPFYYPLQKLIAQCTAVSVPPTAPVQESVVAEQASETKENEVEVANIETKEVVEPIPVKPTPTKLESKTNKTSIPTIEPMSLFEEIINFIINLFSR